MNHAVPEDFEGRKFAFDSIRAEQMYRRDKQWRIFSWAATLLLASIGGIVALAGDGKFQFELCPHRALMVLAVLSISVYAGYWIHENIELEGAAGKALDNYADILGVRGVSPDPKRRPMFGYVMAISLLAFAAVLTIVLVPGQGPATPGAAPRSTIERENCRPNCN
jgi:hypothetical protein